MAAWLVAAAVALSACDAPPRPSASEWAATWERVQAIVPPADELGGEPGDPACEDTLGQLREAREELLPTPDPLVDDAAGDWLEHAEHVFFTCFEGSTVNESYEEMRRRRDEVQTALDDLGGP